MEHRSLQVNIYTALLLSIGIIGGGYFVGNGISKIRVGPRTVRVKGLAEKEVEADVAVWPISFNITANDMQGLNIALKDKENAIFSFLTDAGFMKENIRSAPPMITDLHLAYRGSNVITSERYKAEATITLRTENVKLAREMMGKTTELVERGVALTGDRYRETTEGLMT